MAPADSLILDFDGSVLPLSGSARLDLTAWQEEIRFGCREKSLKHLQQTIQPALDNAPPVVFMGSGDYHHITWLLLQRFLAFGQPIQLVVLDNHPDNMRYPWGIHCGSWVHHVSRLPFVAQINVLGITSTDVEVMHGWENHLRNLRAGKVRYWCIGRDLGWMRALGIRQSNSFDTCGNLIEAFKTHLKVAQMPIYLSIDKDVLSPEDVRTNWDQGVMRLEEMRELIALMRGRIIASDVTGEVSVYHYKSRFKQMLSAMDDQPEISKEQLAEWQAGQQQVNLQLLEWFVGN